MTGEKIHIQFILGSLGKHKKTAIFIEELKCGTDEFLHCHRSRFSPENVSYASAWMDFFLP